MLHPFLSAHYLTWQLKLPLNSLYYYYTHIDKMISSSWFLVGILISQFWFMLYHFCKEFEWSFKYLPCYIKQLKQIVVLPEVNKWFMTIQIDLTIHLYCFKLRDEIPSLFTCTASQFPLIVGTIDTQCCCSFLSNQSHNLFNSLCSWNALGWRNTGS